VTDSKDKDDVSLAESAYRILEEQIATLQRVPGAVLSELKLAKELGIGRSPIREALQRLAYEGLVVILPRRGVLVSDINVTTHCKLIEVRREVERLMVRTACRSATPAQLGEFRSLAARFERCARENDMDAFMQTDSQFNKLLSSSADNEFAEKCIRLMRGLTRRFWFKYCGYAGLKKCARLHANLARAISAQDAAASAAALDGLIDYLDEFTRATLDVRRA
jgi:DNA-binding GntR family transcriptional regulator